MGGSKLSLRILIISLKPTRAFQGFQLVVHSAWMFCECGGGEHEPEDPRGEFWKWASFVWTAVAGRFNSARLQLQEGSIDYGRGIHNKADNPDGRVQGGERTWMP